MQLEQKGWDESGAMFASSSSALSENAYPGPLSGLAVAMQSVGKTDWVTVGNQLLVLDRRPDGRIVSPYPGSDIPVERPAGVVSPANGYAALRDFSGLTVVDRFLQSPAGALSVPELNPERSLTQTAVLLVPQRQPDVSSSSFPAAFATPEKIAATAPTAAALGGALETKTGAMVDLLSGFDANGGTVGTLPPRTSVEAFQSVASVSTSALSAPVANALESLRRFDANGQPVQAPLQEAVSALKTTQPSLLETLKSGWLAQTK